MDKSALSDASAPPRPSRAGSGPLDGARLLIGDVRSDMTPAMRATLMGEGAASVEFCRTTPALRRAVARGGFSFVQVDSALPEGDAVDLVRCIRMGELGKDAFLPVLFTTADLATHRIDAVLAAGVDDVLAKPFSVAALAKRIRRLAVARKPFVAADGYVGPVRARMGPALAAATSFEAPNPLGANARRGGPTAESPAFKEAQRRLTLLRLELATRAVARAAVALAAEEGERAAARRGLSDAAGDLRKPLAATPAGNLRDVIGRLSALADVAAGDGASAGRALRLAVEIAEAVSLIIAGNQGDSFAFPPDITARMDALFPQLASVRAA